MAGSNGDLRPKERLPESTLESSVGRKTGRRVGVGRRRVCGLVVVRPKFHPPINLSRPAGAGRHSCCGLALKLNSRPVRIGFACSIALGLVCLIRPA